MLSVVWLQRPLRQPLQAGPAAPVCREGGGGRPGQGKGHAGAAGPRASFLRVRVWGSPQDLDRLVQWLQQGMRAPAGVEEGTRVGRAGTSRTRLIEDLCAGRRRAASYGMAGYPGPRPGRGQVPTMGWPRALQCTRSWSRPAFGEERGPVRWEHDPMPTPNPFTSGSSAVLGASCSPWGCQTSLCFVPKVRAQNKYRTHHW